MLQRPPSADPNQINRLDEELKRIIKEITRRTHRFSPHDKARIEQWCRKLCQSSMNNIWKQNRNIYALMLFDCVLQNNLREPFTNMPADNYLASTNNYSMKGRIEALKDELNRSDRFVTQEYSPVNTIKTMVYTQTTQATQVTKPSRPPTNIKRDITNLRNSRETPRDRSQRKHTSSVSFNLKSSPSPSSRHKTSFDGRLETKTQESSRSQRFKYEPFHNRIRDDSGDKREQRKKKAQVDLAKSTIMTLKEELNDRLKNITQLNNQFERLNKNAKKMDYERDMMENFLGKFKTIVNDGSASLKDVSTNDDLLRQVNDICDIFKLCDQRFLQRPATTLTATIQESPSPAMSFGKPENYLATSKEMTSDVIALTTNYEKLLDTNKSFNNQLRTNTVGSEEGRRLRFAINF